MYKIFAKRLGIIQGRIVARESKKYQSFPFNKWHHELKLLKKLNLNIIEWVVCAYNKKNPILSDKGIKKILSAKNKLKLKINSITVDYFMYYPFFKKKNFFLRQKIFENLKRIILNSNQIGVKFIILPILEESSINNEIEEKVLIQNLNKFIPILKINKQKILFETDMKPECVSYFLKNFDIKFFGINYDAGNSAGLNYSLTKEKKYFKYVENVHIKDKIKNGKTVRLGYGNANFKLLLKYLKDENYKGNFILQTARSKKNQMNEIKKNLNYIKSINF